MRVEDSETQPPMEWFTGIGRQDTGISNVSPNENFTSLEEGEVGRHWASWTGYLGNPFTPADSPERIERTTNAEVFIKQATGFHPNDILEVSLRLGRGYRGKKEAPFPVELY